MASQWFYEVMGKQVGPVSSAELRSLAERGAVAHNTPVRKGSDGNWVLAERVKGLFAVPNAMSPPPPVTETTQAPLVLEGRQGKSVMVHGNTVTIVRKARIFASQREKGSTDQKHHFGRG